MALTEQQLDILSEALQPLFQYLEKEVIADVARRIQKTLTYTRTAELQAMSMHEMGFSPAKIRSEAMKLLNADKEFRKQVEENTLKYKKEVRELIKEITEKAKEAGDEIVANAGTMAWIEDMRVWQSAGKELEDNSFLNQLVETFSKQTRGELKNLTQTTGFKMMSGYESLESVYRRELDKAMIKICTGTFSREQVLKDTIHALAQSGLRSIDFESGRSMQLDTASRVALRTGCHQLAGRVSDKNIEQMGENLVYVSAHWGARNTGTGHANHARWQGKVYCIKEGPDYSEEAARIHQDSITELWEATGYSVDGTHENDPLGLNGYNCRHNHHPWFVGVSSLPKNKPEPKPVTYNGKTYDYYAMTQKMRSMERGVRALKREKEALSELGMDVTHVKAAISKKTNEYMKFCDLCKINPKPSLLEYECGNSNLKKTKAWKRFADESNKNLDTVVYMSNSFRPQYGKEQTIQYGDIKIVLKEVKNSKYKLLTELDSTERSKVVKLNEKMLKELAKTLPDGYEIPTIAIVDFTKHGLNGNAIAGYDNTTGILYWNAKYDTEKKVKEFLTKEINKFASTDLLAPYKHELGHKQYYDAIKELAKNRGISYNIAQKIIDTRISEFVHEKNEINSLFLLSNISEYADTAYRIQQYTEIIAECNTIKDSKEVAEELLNLLKER